jgi:aspartate carbamoyltransferase catalytic subunit
VRDTLTAPPARTQVPIRHLTGPHALDRALIEQLLEQAAAFEQRTETEGGAPLAGRLLATVFYEPSTRTRFSFEAAMHRLGGQVLSAENATEASSAAKGESLEDGIRVIAGYADGIVLRHPDIGAAERAAQVATVPVISAGDGAGHHPTQALLDLYTIRKELGRLDHLRVGLAGDLRHGRTARSLALLLSRFPQNELVLISPPALRMGADVVGFLEQAQQPLRETNDLVDVLPGLDVLYQTRIQAERFASPDEYEQHRGIYVVTTDVMRRLPEHAILMHPLPRVGEIDPVVDADPRAAYFRQARNGLWVRMAVLDWAMGR